MSSLQQRLAYLGLADFDYLSARVLLCHGLITTGLPRACEAFEKLLKLHLALEAKINRNEELQPKDLKRFGHDLSLLFSTLKSRIAIQYPPEVDAYFKSLTDAYDRRYPEHWKIFSAEINVDFMDGVYGQLRSMAAINFPSEEIERARRFGTFISDAYSLRVRELIRENGGQSIGELLRFKNGNLGVFDINTDHLG